MRYRMVAAAAVALLAAGMQAGIKSVTPVPQEPATNSWWMRRFENEKKLAGTGEYQVIFIGDSITDFWGYPDRGLDIWNRHFTNGAMRAINAGISGDRTEHVLWRIGHGLLDGMRKAKAVILMIGTNNTGHRPLDDEKPAATILGVRLVIDSIREKCPQAVIIVHPILPRSANPEDEPRVRNETVNAAIKEYIAGKDKMVWCDFNDRLLLPGGRLSKTIMPDLLHPGAYGYEVWAAAVVPEIEKALGIQEK